MLAGSIDIGTAWDKWRETHKIPAALLEMYRRYGDRPGLRCETCRQLARDGDDPNNCDDWDERCELIDCDECPLRDTTASKLYCELHRPSERYVGNVADWNPKWAACGAYDGPDELEVRRMRWAGER